MLLIKIARTMNNNVEYMDIDPKNLNEFQKTGWIEIKEPHLIQEPEKKEINPNAHLTPDFDNTDDKILRKMAVANGVPQAKANQMKRDALITYLKG